MSVATVFSTPNSQHPYELSDYISHDYHFHPAERQTLMLMVFFVFFYRCCDVWRQVAWWSCGNARPFGKALNWSFRFRFWLNYELLLCTWNKSKRKKKDRNFICCADRRDRPICLMFACVCFSLRDMWLPTTFGPCFCNNEQINLISIHLSPFSPVISQVTGMRVLNVGCNLIVSVAYFHFICETVCSLRSWSLSSSFL